MTNNNKSGKKGWTSLNGQEFEMAYHKVCENAERHFNCTQILANANEYPNAVAHLILGSEELVKSLFCQLMAKGVDLKQVPWFIKIFYHHKTRHDLLKDYFLVYSLFFNKVMPSRQRNDGFLKSLGIAIARTTLTYASYKWWENADNLKQRAFYVDYIEELIVPTAIGEREFETANNIVRIFREDMSQLQQQIKQQSGKQLTSLISELKLIEIEELRQKYYKEKKKLIKNGQY